MQRLPFRYRPFVDRNRLASQIPKVLVDDEIGLDQRLGQFACLIVEGPRSGRSVPSGGDKVRRRVHSPAAWRRRKAGDLCDFRKCGIKILIEANQIQRRQVSDRGGRQALPVLLRLRKLFQLQCPRELPSQEIVCGESDNRMSRCKKLLQRHVLYQPHVFIVSNTGRQIHGMVIQRSQTIIRVTKKRERICVFTPETFKHGPRHMTRHKARVSCLPGKQICVVGKGLVVEERKAASLRTYKFLKVAVDRSTTCFGHMNKHHERAPATGQGLRLQT